MSRRFKVAALALLAILMIPLTASSAATAETLASSNSSAPEGSSAGLSIGASGCSLVVLVCAIGTSLALITRRFTGSRGENAPKHRSPLRSGFDTATRLTAATTSTRDQTNQLNELLPINKAYENSALTFSLAMAY
ncbi:MAG TPA: hypothetical protein VFJ57_10130 [Solirubrobacterales bacterium]|nr:hypothetical protein [Solirubrobacterales bacterium]